MDGKIKKNHYSPHKVEPNMEKNKEQEKIENLLKPRYKVMADYPNSYFKVGDILKNKPNDILDRLAYWGCDKFPHLFRKLEWWEERTVEEMPEYMKRVRYQGNSNTDIKIGDIVQVRWRIDNPDLSGFPKLRVLQFTVIKNGQVGYDENCFLPVTPPISNNNQ